MVREAHLTCQLVSTFCDPCAGLAFLGGQRYEAAYIHVCNLDCPWRTRDPGKRQAEILSSLDYQEPCTSCIFTGLWRRKEHSAPWVPRRHLVGPVPPCHEQKRSLLGFTNHILTQLSGTSTQGVQATMSSKAWLSMPKTCLCGRDHNAGSRRDLLRLVSLPRKHGAVCNVPICTPTQI